MSVPAASTVRNIGLFSHGGAGKTTLSEAMLFAAGVINRAGRPDDGTTVSDYEPEEQKRQVSVNLAVLPFAWKGCKVNLLDAPGVLDFAGEVRQAIRAVDTGLILVDAVAGPEVGTDLVWRQLRATGTPRGFVISKIDRENADFGRALDSLRARYGAAVVALQCPIHDQSGFVGTIDVISGGASRGTDGAAFDPPPGVVGSVDQMRERLIEAVAETDDDLIAKYLEGETLTSDEIGGALRKAIATERLFPVFVVAGLPGLGVRTLMDAIVDVLPSPEDVAPVTATEVASGKAVQLQPSEGAPPVALVFKTMADPFVGKLTYFRVLTGIVRADSHLWNASSGHDERLGTLYVVRGKSQEPCVQVGPGDIGAVAKLQNTATGHTLTTRDRQVRVEPIAFPNPVYSVAVDPKSKADLDKLGGALQRIVEEDPTLTVRRDPETGETVMSGLGEQHIDVTLERMRRKFGVEVTTREPKVPYRETIQRSAQAEYKHKKQTGGHGQYGHVFLEVEPLPRGAGFEFTERVVGGSVPRNFIPAVEKGVRESLPGGVFAGCPVVDVRVTLFDGSFHPVDSSEMAFKLASSQAFRKGFEDGQPILLEPICDLDITVPESFVGDVMSDLNGKRARVQGMDPEGDVTTVHAQAPLAEIQRYATDLRSITQGRGTYTMKFSHYEEVPAHVAQAVISEQKKAAAAAH